MDTRLNNAVYSFRRLEFEQAARQIEEIESKRDKAKTKLTDEQESMLAAVKCCSFVKLGRYGEAAKVIEAVNLSTLKDLEMLPLFMDSAYELDVPHKVQEIIKGQEKVKEKHPPVSDTQGFPMLKSYMGASMFSEASKYCLMIFNSTKSENPAFWQVYLEFLEILKKAGLLLDKRDSIFKVKPGINFMIIDLFWNKFLLNNPLEYLIKQNKPSAQDAVIFHTRLQIMQQKYDAALETIQKYGSAIKYPIRLTDLYCSLYQNSQKPEHLEVLLRHYQFLFRKNMNIGYYYPLYDLYEQYRVLLPKENNLVISHILPYKRFSESNLTHYLNSLISEYKSHEANEQLFKLDHFKTALKTLLLQILTILKEQKSPERQDFLKEFVRHFGKTHTFCEYFVKICPDGYDLPTEVPSYSPEALTILKLNKIKLDYIYGNKAYPKDKSALYYLMVRHYEMYLETLDSIDRRRNLEKGYRYLADEYIVILADLFRYYLEEHDDLEVIWNLVLLIEHCIKISDYNFSLKVRLIYLYEKIGMADRLLYLYETLDIKSVLFETTGHMVYGSLLGREKENEDLLVRALRSYQDNTREIKYYTYKCLERRQLSTIEQFVSYDNWTDRSYSKTMLFRIYANKFKNTENDEAYCRLILKQLRKNRKLTMPCDLRVRESTVSSKRQTINIFGVFNSPKMLKNDVVLRLEQLKLLYGRTDLDVVENLEAVSFEYLLDLSIFDFLRYPYVYRQCKSTEYTALHDDYKCISKIHRFQWLLNKVVRAILTKSQEDQIQNASEVEKIVTYLQKDGQNPRQLFAVQRYMPNSIMLINYALRMLSKNKKKKEYDKKLGYVLRNISQAIYAIVSGFDEKRQIEEVKPWLKELDPKELQTRLTRLFSQLALKPKQYDSLYKIG